MLNYTYGVLILWKVFLRSVKHIWCLSRMLRNNQEIFGTLYRCPWNSCSASGAVGLNSYSHPPWVKNSPWEGLRKQYLLSRYCKDATAQLCSGTPHLRAGALRILRRNRKHWEPEIHWILPLVKHMLWAWKPLTWLLFWMPKEIY